MSSSDEHCPNGTEYHHYGNDWYDTYDTNNSGFWYEAEDFPAAEISRRAAYLPLSCSYRCFRTRYSFLSIRPLRSQSSSCAIRFLLSRSKWSSPETFTTMAGASRRRLRAVGRVLCAAAVFCLPCAGFFFRFSLNITYSTMKKASGGRYSSRISRACSARLFSQSFYAFWGRLFRSRVVTRARLTRLPAQLRHA